MRMLWKPRFGGLAWMYINWALGLQANGCRVTVLESYQRSVAPDEALRRLQAFRSHLTALGLQADMTLLLSPEQRERFRPLQEQFDQLALPLDEAIEDSELLLNCYYGLDPGVVGRFRRSALMDLDPGLVQVWISEGQLNPAPHDIYFTIGETVGTPGALFPDCGLQWHYTPPAVFLPVWPAVHVDSDAPFTTVTNWWAERSAYVLHRGQVFDNQKRTSFLEYLDLPSRTAEALELAIYPTKKGNGDRRRLLEHGWRVRDSLDVSSTPLQFRAYIQQSRGEFSCAKPSCMRLQNAWISDRTICYLASGRPAVVQHTGPSRFLPDAAGLFRFRTLEEAAGALASVASDYQRQSRLARSLAEEYFDATKAAASVLQRAMAVRPRHH
jgi:hypothetical protein